MNESKFCLELKKSLRQHGWFMKTHGGQFVEPGIPDLIGCTNGKFIAIECKLTGNALSPAQGQQLYNIRQAGGKSYLIMLDNSSRGAAVYRCPFLVLGFKIYRLPGGTWDLATLLEDINK